MSWENKYKPTNFKVNKGNKGAEEEYLGEMGGEEVMMVDNYQILSKILVFFIKKMGFLVILMIFIVFLYFL